MAQEKSGEIWVNGFSDAELTPLGDPAMQGEHNADILGELGYDQAEIDRLTASGALIDNAAARMIATVVGTAPTSA